MKNVELRHIALRLLSLLLLTLTPTLARADEKTRLFERIKAAAAFDYNYPRERVVVHLDNNGYFEGDTIWLKAYVLRASSLRPTDLSRVLYAELLDADGRLRERKLLRIDSLGQAWGEFALALPIRSGFYEVRAYTREMLNWGTDAIFSRVVPVFRSPGRGTLNASKTAETLGIDRPTSERELAPGHPRPFEFGKAGEARLSFFPEGGNRVAGAAQRIGFKTTDGSGVPTTDSVRVFAADGTLLAAVEPQHEGMGVFALPAHSEGAYATVGSGRALQKFSLPEGDPAARFVLSAEESDEGVDVVVTGVGEGGPSLLGIAAFCREQMCYVDTLSVGQESVSLSIPWTALREGVNRIELFDADGNGLARRLVWKTPTAAKILTLGVRQNATKYNAYDPIALELTLSDETGRPVKTNVSLAVRDDGGELVDTERESLERMLLSSEVRGYIHRPEFYFGADTERCRRALSLLLLVQGWAANDFATMSGRDAFNLEHPIEEQLTLMGTVKSQNKAQKPQAGMQLQLQMYSLAGGSLSAKAITDSLGRFAFVSNVDYVGEWIAQVTTRDENDRRRWSHVSFDRWFGATPRAFSPFEMQPSPAVPLKAEAVVAETFAWQDTIRHRRIDDVQLRAAEVVAQKYKGFSGNRFSYNGGENTLKRSADLFYDIETEVERKKDRGEETGVVWDLLSELNPQFTFDTFTDEGAAQDAAPTYNIFYRNRKLGRASFMWAEEVKSVAFMEPRNGYLPTLHDVSAQTYDGSTQPGVDYNNSAAYNLSPTWAAGSEQSGKGNGENANEAMPTFDRVQGSAGDDGGASALHRYVSSDQEIGLLVFERPDYFRFKTKRGVDKRKIFGFSAPKKFYNPDYSGTALPDDVDTRRTLYWNPCVETDASGRAVVSFFGNARMNQQLRISARAVTADGRFLFYER